VILFFKSAASWVNQCPHTHTPSHTCIHTHTQVHTRCRGHQCFMYRVSCIMLILVNISVNISNLFLQEPMCDTLAWFRQLKEEGILEVIYPPPQLIVEVIYLLPQLIVEVIYLPPQLIVAECWLTGWLCGWFARLAASQASKLIFSFFSSINVTNIFIAYFF